MASSSRLQDTARSTTAGIADDRRSSMRLSADDLLWLGGVRIKYGADVRVIDLSAGGMLLESDEAMRPDTTVVFEVAGPDATTLAPARVLRCRPLEKEGKKRYQTACAFKRPLTIPDLIAPQSKSASNARPAAVGASSPNAPSSSAPVSTPVTIPAPASSNARAIGQKVIARFLDGRLVRGYTTDFNASKPHLHLTAEGSNSAQFVRIAELKAVFFVREFAGNAQRVESKEFAPTAYGRKVEVTFKDGEVIVGSTIGFKGKEQPFFISPADAESNNLRVFIPPDATRQVRLLQ